MYPALPCFAREYLFPVVFPCCASCCSLLSLSPYVRGSVKISTHLFEHEAGDGVVNLKIRGLEGLDHHTEIPNTPHALKSRSHFAILPRFHRQKSPFSRFQNF